MKSSTPTPSLKVHHRVRTFFASVFATLAMALVLAAILVVWLNHTLTDNAAYVQAVTPLVSQPAVQSFVAQKVSDQLLSNVSPDDLAQQLLAPADVAGKTPAQVTELVRSTLNTDVSDIMASPSFKQVWINTNKTAQAQFVKQIDSDSPDITLDLSQSVTDAVAILKASKLAPIANKIDVPAKAGVIDIKSSNISKVHRAYHWFKTGTLVLVIVLLVLVGLAVWISVHHLKTLRRMLVSTGVIALLFAGALQLAYSVQLKTDDEATSSAVKAIAHVLVGNLQLTCLVVAGVAIVLAAGSKAYEKMNHH